MLFTEMKENVETLHRQLSNTDYHCAASAGGLHKNWKKTIATGY